MKNLNAPLLVVLTSLLFACEHTYSSSRDLSALSSSLTSLADYAVKVKPVAPITPITTPPVIPATAKQSIIRADFFKDIVNMDEQKFRQDYGWHQDGSNDWGALAHTPALNLNTWINEYPRRAAIFQGEFSTYTPKDLNQLMGTTVLTRQPYFRIIIHNPENPEQTDIRALQADPSLKFANFQLASTLFGPLEGGMYRWKASLGGMLERPVQGEEASISAAPATIFRKYFMKPRYLLSNLKDKFIIGQGKFGPYIDASNYYTEDKDMDEISIGIHKNIVVSSGYGLGNSGPNGRPGRYDSQERLMIDVKNDKVDVGNTQIIHQIFTSAYDLGRAYKKYGQNNLPINISDAAQMILSGMYKGALGAPFATKSPVIFLTMLGAGAFLNDPMWIYGAIEPHKDFIKERGLQITLIYRPDPRKATRNPDKDSEFLINMLEMADTINKNNLARDPGFKNILKKYLDASYSTDPIIQKTQGPLAAELNYRINNALPSYAPKIKLKSTFVPTTPLDKSNTTVPQGLDIIQNLNNGHKLAWKPVGNDAVLINIDPSNSLYNYIAPGYPGQSLPNGLYYWKSQGLDLPQIGNHKNMLVKNHPKGKTYIYNSGQKKYVDSHHPNITWDASSHPKDPK